MSPSVLCLLLPLLFLLSPAMAEPSVDISISPATTVRLGDKVRVTCYVAGLRPNDFVFKLRLFCPILPNDLACFQNCKATCQAGTGCKSHQTKLMSATRCETFKGTDKLQFFYEFPYNAVEYSGHYMCQFFGKNSARTLLPKPLMPPTTKPPAITTGKAKPPPSSSKKPERPPTKEPTKPPTKPPQRGPQTWAPWCGPNGENCVSYRISGASTRERLLVIVVILFFISVIVNALFCIRCVLINHYAKDPRKLQRMSYCMSGFLCLDPEVYLRKRESMTTLRPSRSVSLMAAHHVHDDAGGSDSTYSMPAYLPVPHHGHSRSQTLPTMIAAPGADSQRNIVYIPVVASSLNHLGAESQTALNFPLNDAAVQRCGVPLVPAGGAGGDRIGVGASSRCLAVSPQPVAPPPIPNDTRRLSMSASRLNGRTSGRHRSGDSTREVDEEETLIE